MAIVRITEEVFMDDDLLGALARFFDTMDLIDDDRYRKTKDFYVTGEGIPEGPAVIHVSVYYFDGIRPFVLEVE